MSQQQMRSFIVTLAHGTMQKRLYLAGTDDSDADKRFEAARRTFDAVGEAATDWSQFYAAAVSHFASHGFVRVPK